MSNAVVEKRLIDCRRCQEKVPRDEADTDDCSGCAATYDRDYFGSSDLLKRFPAPTAAPTAATVEKVQKPCGTCGTQGHHSRQCEKYLVKLLEKFQPCYSWAMEMINRKHPAYLYIAQSCIKLGKGSKKEKAKQALALKAWKCINWREHLTPQAVLEALILWNEICEVAFATGNPNYFAVLSHFLMKDGCSHWMRMLKEEMQSGKYPGVEDIHEFNDDTDEVWGRIMYATEQRFTEESRATKELERKTYACTHPARCSNCSKLGHKSNGCPK
jgi:hypothetical protein